MIHILRYGSPLCRFTVHVPADWPEGHQWIHYPDPGGTATCEGCKAALCAPMAPSGPLAGHRVK